MEASFTLAILAGMALGWIWRPRLAANQNFMEALRLLRDDSRGMWEKFCEAVAIAIICMMGIGILATIGGMVWGIWLACKWAVLFACSVVIFMWDHNIITLLVAVGLIVWLFSHQGVLRVVGIILILAGIIMLAIIGFEAWGVFSESWQDWLKAFAAAIMAMVMVVLGILLALLKKLGDVLAFLLGILLAAAMAIGQYLWGFRPSEQKPTPQTVEPSVPVSQDVLTMPDYIVVMAQPGDGCIRLTRRVGRQLDLDSCISMANQARRQVTRRGGVIIAPMVQPGEAWRCNVTGDGACNWEMPQGR